MSRLLDLFCGAGGCSVGYHRAGFEVVGVDNRPMPNYPFEFHQTDALDFLAEHGHEFDVIHASPPCQAYVQLAKVNVLTAKNHPDMVGVTRKSLRSIAKPYVIENVVGSPLRDAIMLCGSAFGLGVRRHRLFESNYALLSPGCRHTGHESRGVYGHHPDGGRIWTRRGGGVHRRAFTLEDGQQRMGIDWMTWRELTQAIPPAYTEFIGRQIIAAERMEAVS